MSFVCNNCGLKYQRKLCYDKHVILCKFMKKKDVRNNNRVPSMGEMYTLFNELNNIVVKLSKKVEDIERVVNSKKRKINLIDWLNTHSKLSLTYFNWLEFLPSILNRTHLELVFKYDFIEGVIYIFHSILPFEDITKSVIRSFGQKENVLFIYSNNNEWRIMTSEEYEYMINRIMKNLIGLFKDWTDENERKMNDDKFSRVYAENVKKVLGSNFQRERLYSRLKSKLYKYFKQDLKNIIEYEFS